MLAAGPNFIVEGFGTPSMPQLVGLVDPQKRQLHDKSYESIKLQQEIGRLQARMHAVPTTWLTDEHRKILQDLCPLLKEEPLNSALYSSIAYHHARGGLTEDLPPTDKLRALMAALPKPEGAHANRLVSVHGDLWHENMLRYNGELMAIDFESMALRSAASDLGLADDGLTMTKARTDLQFAYPEKSITEQEEVFKMYLEGLVGQTINYCILRRFIASRVGYDDAQREKMEKLIEAAPLFAALVEKCRAFKFSEKKWEQLPEWLAVRSGAAALDETGLTESPLDDIMDQPFSSFIFL
ncbi:unnamed protein product [Polarella glacialis]|uniref:Aminoglycoside phosphotransferase domain-containing protein n=1 Tax=Polarella glacialis TaxID=89957 RepID=A0A813HEV0_POLGL|nr:unnamed protein product [Polarella glacialis]